MISYIVMCISVDGTMPLGETLTEKIIDVTLVLLKVYNRVPKMGADVITLYFHLVNTYLHAIIIAEVHVHEVRASVAPYLRKCGTLAIREILIKHDCTPIHLSTQQVHDCIPKKTNSINRFGTQMQHEVIWAENCLATPIL